MYLLQLYSGEGNVLGKLEETVDSLAPVNSVRLVLCPKFETTPLIIVFMVLHHVFRNINAMTGKDCQIWFVRAGKQRVWVQSRILHFTHYSFIFGPNNYFMLKLITGTCIQQNISKKQKNNVVFVHTLKLEVSRQRASCCRGLQKLARLCTEHKKNMQKTKSNKSNKKNQHMHNS